MLKNYTNIPFQDFWCVSLFGRPRNNFGVRDIDDFARHQLFFDTLIRSIFQNSKNANLRNTSDSKMNAFSHSRSRSRFGWETCSRLGTFEGPLEQPE